MPRLAWLVLCVTLVAATRPARYAKKDVEEDFELLSKDLKEELKKGCVTTIAIYGYN